MKKHRSSSARRFGVVGGAGVRNGEADDLCGRRGSLRVFHERGEALRAYPQNESNRFGRILFNFERAVETLSGEWRSLRARTRASRVAWIFQNTLLRVVAKSESYWKRDLRCLSFKNEPRKCRYCPSDAAPRAERRARSGPRRRACIGEGGLDRGSPSRGVSFSRHAEGAGQRGGTDAALTRERSLGFNLRTRKRVLAPFGAALRAAEARLLALQL